MVTKECRFCQKQFEAKPSNKVFCSKECSALFHAHQRKDWEVKKCVQCSSEFEPNTHNKRFCSKDCATKYHKIKRESERETKVEKVLYANCRKCGNQFIVTMHHHKHCSSECRRSYWKEKTIKNLQEDVRICLNCNSNFLTNHPSKKYCSDQCRDIYNKEYQKRRTIESAKEKVKDIEHRVRDLVIKVNTFNVDETGILLNQYNINGFSEALRLRVKERDLYQCQICNSETDLEVHHIIPQQKGGSHDLENLITLCTKCHRHIETGDEEHAVRKCVRNYSKKHNILNERNEVFDKKANLNIHLKSAFKKLRGLKGEELQEILILIDDALEILND